MRKLYLFIIASAFCIQLSAQSTVTGSVIETTSKKPVEFATVELLRIPDSSVIKGTVTDKRGRFILPEINPGEYIIRSSYVGYDNIVSARFTLLVGVKQFSVGQLQFISSSHTLNTVTVAGKKARLNTSIDRKIYNVEQDIMSRSGTASDILRNIPSVEVDVEGNVALRGSGDVMILINGKPNPLMGRTRAEVLQQLPANSIERIEVITNPSARYRPDGTGGIINIVLKKNIRNGFNGSATLTTGNRDRYNGSASVNYKPKNLNLFGSYSLRKDTRKRYNTIDRTYIDSTHGSLKSTYRQSTNSVTHPQAHIISAGSDYTLNEKNSFGVSGTYFYRQQLVNHTTLNTSFSNSGSLIQDYDRLRYDPEIEKESNGTFYFQHNFAPEGHDLRIELNVAREHEVEDNHFTNIFRLPAQPATMDNTLIRQGLKEKQLTIDYVNEFSEDSKLEAGYDGLFDNSDLNFYGEKYNEFQKKFEKDVTRTNRFIYKETVHALYGTFQKSFEKFGYEFGLRAEGVITKGHLITIDSFVNNNYLKVYPTLHLSYQFSGSKEIQLNYSKRVNRPEADELNPFPEYQDPRNLRSGNPKLLPEIIHSMEFGYRWQNSVFTFVPSIYYRYKHHGFTSVVVPLDDSTLLSTTQNLSNDQSAGLETIISAKTKRFFSASLSVNFFYNRIDAEDLGYVQNRSIYSASANLTSTFTFTKTSMLQISGNYRSARLTPQGKTYPTIVINTGVRQDLAGNKLSITVTVSDLFSSLKQRTELNTPYLRQVSLGRRDGLIIYLGASYRFGVVKKTKEEKLQFDNTL